MDHTAVLPRETSALQARHGRTPGLLLCAATALIATAIAHLGIVQQAGLNALTLSIILGIVLGNTVLPAIAPRCGAGIDFSKNFLLRAGIILFGFRITFQDISQVGIAGAVIAVVMVACTFFIAVQVGTRLLGMDRQTSMLIGAGSAICGAAAIMATAPIIQGQAHKVSVAVCTVVLFGTLAMFAYPALYPLISLSEHAFGIYIGSTIHEVAQVVAAGAAVNDVVAGTAVIEKMMRVMLLAPFLLLLSVRVSTGGRPSGVTVPWFALLFVVAAGVNSLQWLPTAMVNALVQLDTALLAMAMAALGMRTSVRAVVQAGLKPLLLATMLFVFLTLGGLGINIGILALLG